MTQLMRLVSKSATLEAGDYSEYSKGIVINFTYTDSNYPNFRIDKNGTDISFSSCSVYDYNMEKFYKFFQEITSIVTCLKSIGILPIDQQFTILQVYFTNFMKIFDEEFQIFTR